MKLMLVDDDCLVVNALKTILESQPDLTVAATADNGSLAFDLYKEHRRRKCTDNSNNSHPQRCLEYPFIRIRFRQKH